MFIRILNVRWGATITKENNTKISLHTYLLLMDIINRCHLHQLHSQGFLYLTTGSQPRDSRVSIPPDGCLLLSHLQVQLGGWGCVLEACAVTQRKEAELATCTSTDQVVPSAAPTCDTDRTTAKSSSSSWADMESNSLAESMCVPTHCTHK